MSRQNSSSDLVIGGEPRVDLLPPEVRLARRGAVARRGLIALVFVCLIVVIGGYVLASMHAKGASDDLIAEQAKTTSLLTEQQKYIAVRQATVAIASAEAATRVGDSTEIDWAQVIQQLTANLPGNVTNIVIDSVTPVKAFAQPTVPLASGRIATVTIMVSVPSIPAATEWIGSLASVKGVSGTSITSVQAQGPSTFSVSAVVGINKDALANPLTTKDSK
jgi:hypothetical protein